MNCYDGHDGYDFSRPMENGGYFRVLAAADGTVSWVGWHNLGDRGAGWGLYIEITHSNGYVTRYAHLSAAAVSPGDYVRAGQIIGTSGRTGAVTGVTGVHLHFGVRSGNIPVDPFGWSGAGADPWAAHAQGATSWFMWAGGEFAGSPLADPTPAGSPTIYVDDTTDNTGGFSKGSGGPFNNPCQGNCGGWTSAAAGSGNDMYYTLADRTRAEGGDQWARWQPTIPLPGVYEVWVHVPNVNATSWQAPYVIDTGTGQFTAYGVDQLGLSNQWVCIGAYHFLSGLRSVYVTDATGEAPDHTGRRVGVDEVKFIRRPTYPVYAPDTRTTGGWSCQVIVRNNGSSSADVYISYLDSSGAFACGSPSNGPSAVPANGTVTFSASCGGVAAVVDASQDVAVVVRNQRNNEITMYNGIRAAGGSLGWEQVGTTLYAPVVKNNWNGRYSAIEVLNVGSVNTNVTAHFYERNTGTYRGSASVPNLAPNARYTFSATPCPSGSFCAVRLESSNGQVLAAVVREYASGDLAPTTHNVFSAAATTNYAPLVKNSYNGQTSGLTVYNTGSVQTYVTVTYYDSSSSNTFSTGDWLPAYATRTFYDPAGLPDGFLGSAIISANRPLVSAVHESGDGRYKATDAVLAGGTTLFVAELNTSSGYGSAISVQNVGGSTANVIVHYYYSDGTSAGVSGPHTIGAGRTRVLSNYNGGIPSGFYGSAWVESTNGIPVAAMVHYSGPGSGDINATYNGSQP